MSRMGYYPRVNPQVMKDIVRESRESRGRVAGESRLSREECS